MFESYGGKQLHHSGQSVPSCTQSERNSLTAEALCHLCQSSVQQRKKGEGAEDFLCRISHVNLANRSLLYLDSCIKNCCQARVLYLYDNLLVQLDNLKSCHSLTHLYLQNNNLTQLSGLEGLSTLRKLYVDGNMIARVDGLQDLQQLQELHISEQRLPEGVALEFGAECLQALSRTLVSLSAAKNGIADIAPLAALTSLRQLNLSSNRLPLDGLEHLRLAIAPLEKLTCLDLRDNLICKAKKYRDSIVLTCASLTELDSKNVGQSERLFLHEMLARKLKLSKSMTNIANRSENYR
eukprot:CAMPEP_0177588794 /NCGR_PEP_ID=MMETSP0419_2-20121207/6427_1 /TAXON_ID=582737 /ORGANISM="Tetraselmis sp., Strain GSL018" /LENGTH=294 /DNA_ID=CAMNT_0019079039 /DNA_START=151 /DNA_END=1036 /DNA_ORIENTATION=-